MLKRGFRKPSGSRSPLLRRFRIGTNLLWTWLTALNLKRSGELQPLSFLVSAKALSALATFGLFYSVYMDVEGHHDFAKRIGGLTWLRFGGNNKYLL